MVFIRTGEYVIKSLELSDSGDFVSYLLKNKPFFESVEPCRPEYYYTEIYWQNLMAPHPSRKPVELRFIIKSSSEIVGFVGIHGISGYPAYSGMLGYSLDHGLWGRGIMTDCLSRLIAYLFLHMPLHRLTAAYMPANIASGRVLEKLGFTDIGIVREYLFINGRWEDHMLSSLLSPTFKMPSMEMPARCPDKKKR
ncbi:MAG: GNAT family N-acetyltransferase [Spirochaetales bacterium]|nr:GNAT family N-acetyltransferase [Spirochaetales bacterium]